MKNRDHIALLVLLSAMSLALSVETGSAQEPGYRDDHSGIARTVCDAA